MNTLRRWLIALPAALVCASSFGQVPSRPVRLINPFGPGGGADVVVRPAMEAVASMLGRTFIMEFKPGASGIIAAELLESSPADGSALIIDTQSLSNNGIFRKVPYDHGRWEPVARVGFIPLGLLVSNKFPAKTLRELVDHARRHSGQVTYATVGPGTVPHLAALRFEQAMGVKLLAVPYKSSPDVYQDLIAGRIDIYFDGTTQGLPVYRNGQARLLGTSTAARLTVAPEIPTLKEQGFDLVTGGWFGISAPRGTPREVVEKYSAAFVSAVNSAAYVKRMEKLGVVAAGLDAAAFDAFRKDDRQQWAELVKRSRLVVD